MRAMMSTDMFFHSITLPKFCHMLKISQPIITLMSPYLHDKKTKQKNNNKMWLKMCAHTDGSCRTAC